MNLNDKTKVARMLGWLSALGSAVRVVSESEGGLYKELDPESELWHVESEEWISALAIDGVSIPPLGGPCGSVRVWQRLQWDVVNNYSEVRKAKLGELERKTRERLESEARAAAEREEATLETAARIYAAELGVPYEIAIVKLRAIDPVKKISVLAALLALEEIGEENPSGEAA